METDKQKQEQELFRYLDRVCEPASTPMPHKLCDMPIKCEILGFMGRMISHAFQNMRDSGGTTNWECDARVALGSKISAKRVVTLNTLRKYLMECQGADLVEYSKEVADKITVKPNVIMLFESVLNGEMAQ